MIFHIKIHLQVSFLCLSSRYFRLFSQKYDFGIFRGSLGNRGFTPLNSQVWNFQDFVIMTNKIIRLLKKKVNNFIHFCGNGEKNGKSIFTFFTVVLEFPVRVSSSPCYRVKSFFDQYIHAFSPNRYKCILHSILLKRW